MRNIDTSIYSAEKPSRIKPDEIDLSALPRIEKRLPVQPQPAATVFPAQSAESQNPDVNKTERNSVRKSERTEKRSEYRTDIRTDRLPIKRKTKRYSFEFYDDQLTGLKNLKHRVEAAGENITLSEMVRQAVDTYLKAKGE